MNISTNVVILLGLIVVNYVSLSVQNRRVKRIVGGQLAAAPPPDDPVVFTNAYSRNARVEGYRSEVSGLYSFLGIRFAEPPIGQFRFRRPQYKRLEGDINATVFGMPCPQPDSAGYIVGSEDCLWLNVYTPRMPDESTGLPVIVWIHGGGYRYGSANQYTADSLTSKGVIFVPIQYRLGTLGILGDGTTEFSGNAALFDMGAALRWVHEYIQFFGGDPKQIVVAGQGSGATAATYFTTTQRQSREMVSGVIAMSGSTYTPNAIDTTPKQTSKEIIDINGCAKGNETEIVKCMREKSFEDIIRLDSKVQIERMQNDKVVGTLNGMVGYQPTIDGNDNERSLPGFLQDDPRNVITNGTFKRVPLLTGVTRDETANAINIKSIEKTFTSTTKFLDSVATTVQKSGMGIDIGQMVGKLLPGIAKSTSLNDYLKVSDTLNVVQVIQKLTEATTDALFNLPALLTTQLWAKLAPAYLYSFEHIGKSSNRGSTFLNGLPIVGNARSANDTPENVVAHGDELAYLFDAHNIFGKPLSEKTNTLDADDAKVREIFSNLITQFVHSNGGQEKQGDATKKSPFQTFKPDESNFIRIGQADATHEKDFRYCQLALWGALVKPSSKDTSCKFIVNQLAASLLTATGNVPSTLGNTLGNILPLSGGSGNGGGSVVPSNQIGTAMHKPAHKSSTDTDNDKHKHGSGILGIG